ncbi:C45 family autoproteolytic acyltransferase/hydolase [Dongia sp.]|uniref:C45 family autoproteolytic acyltransferase/hydolase n=1 Tax=Dongia sp. TaxID=1977262 RepID=UPI003752D2A6
MTLPGMPLPIITLRGAPFDRGFQHGAQFRHEVAAAVAKMKAGQGEARTRRAAGLALDAWPRIKAEAPAPAAELEGLAAGAGLDLVDILLHSGFEFFGDGSRTGCSAIAAAGPRAALVAQNWDAAPEVAPELALFLHIGPAGFEQAIVGSLGGLGWVGCNRHGLAFVNNDLVLSSTGPGLPSQVVRRLILEQETVGAAAERLRGLRHMAGRSYLLGDAAGAVAGIEVSAREGACILQTVGPVLHANHALNAGIAADQSEAALQRTYPSSRHRQAILERKAPAQASVRSIAALLSDREGAPEAVARTAVTEEPTVTLFSVIFDCAARSLHLCAGAPTDADSYQPVTW